MYISAWCCYSHFLTNFLTDQTFSHGRIIGDFPFKWISLCTSHNGIGFFFPIRQFLKCNRFTQCYNIRVIIIIFNNNSISNHFFHLCNPRFNKCLTLETHHIPSSLISLQSPLQLLFSQRLPAVCLFLENVILSLISLSPLVSYNTLSL